MGQARDDLGKLVLRLSVGGMLLTHGITKALNGIDFVQGQLAESGLPAFIAYGAFVGEIVAPLALIAGLFSRPAGIVIAVNMALAVYLAKPDALVMISGGGAWGIEVEALFGLGGIAVALLGAGRFSVSKGAGRWD